MGVSKNMGTPKSSILIGFSIINHPFWGTSIFGNTHIENNNLVILTTDRQHLRNQSQDADYFERPLQNRWKNCRIYG